MQEQGVDTGRAQEVERVKKNPDFPLATRRYRGILISARGGERKETP